MATIHSFGEWGDAMNGRVGFRTADVSYFHLTAAGWVRHDTMPFPDSRRETWLCKAKPAADGATQIITLNQIWISPSLAHTESDDLHALFGDAVTPEPGFDRSARQPALLIAPLLPEDNAITAA